MKKRNIRKILTQNQKRNIRKMQNKNENMKKQICTHSPTKKRIWKKKYEENPEPKREFKKKKNFFLRKILNQKEYMKGKNIRKILNKKENLKKINTRKILNQKENTNKQIQGKSWTKMRIWKCQAVFIKMNLNPITDELKDFIKFEKILISKRIIF